MNSISLLVGVTIATALAGCASVSEYAHAESRHLEKPSTMLRVVATSSEPGQLSHGWRYFSNPWSTRAVVISPAGEYFLSRGEGPKQVTGPAGGVLTTRP